MQEEGRCTYIPVQIRVSIDLCMHGCMHACMHAKTSMYSYRQTWSLCGFAVWKHSLARSCRICSTSKIRLAATFCQAAVNIRE